MVAASFTPLTEERRPPRSIPGPRPGLRLVLDALDAVAPRDVVLCFDFGTATSKVGAARRGREPLPIRLAFAQDGATSGFAVDSTLLATPDGRLLFGPEARAASLATRSPRLDSLKRTLGYVPLDRDLDTIAADRSGAGLSLGAALRYYLAWLTARASRAARTQHGFRSHLLRRFAVPCWPSARSEVLRPKLARLFAEAILVADTLGEDLEAGVPVDTLVHLFDLASRSRLPTHLVGQAVQEPVAAAASRFGPESPMRGLVLVVDVGAGTTDLALFVVDADPAAPRFEIRPIEGGADLLPRAGDTVDRALVQLVLERLGPSRAVAGFRRRRLAVELEARALKERLLSSGEASLSLGDGETVTLERSLLLDHPDVAGFEGLLRERVRALLGRLPEERCRALAPGGLTVCLAGGGARLPFVASLVRGFTVVHGARFEHQPGPELPQFLSKAPELRSIYPRLAVAVGGASGYLPREGIRYARIESAVERALRPRGRSSGDGADPPRSS